MSHEHDDARSSEFDDHELNEDDEYEPSEFEEKLEAISDKLDSLYDQDCVVTLRLVESLNGKERDLCLCCLLMNIDEIEVLPLDDDSMTGIVTVYGEVIETINGDQETLVQMPIEDGDDLSLVVQDDGLWVLRSGCWVLTIEQTHDAITRRIQDELIKADKRRADQDFPEEDDEFEGDEEDEWDDEGEDADEWDSDDED